MPFADTTSTKFSGKKTAFMPITQGIRVIRLLDKSATRVFTHWVNGYTVKCLGSECPICQKNKQIIAENPNNFRNIKGYIGARKTFYVNVLDRTPVKKVEDKEYYPDLAGNFPALTEDGKSLKGVEAEISNTVKVLNRGVELFDQFNTYEGVYKDEEGNTLSLNDFDIKLNIPANKRPVVIAEPDKREEVNPEDYELYDLESVVITLESDEIEELLRGVKLRDIFAARKIEEPEEVLDEDIEYEADDISDLDEVDI